MYESKYATGKCFQVDQQTWAWDKVRDAQLEIAGCSRDNTLSSSDEAVWCAANTASSERAIPHTLNSASLGPQSALAPTRVGAAGFSTRRRRRLSTYTRSTMRAVVDALRSKTTT